MTIEEIVDRFHNPDPLTHAERRAILTAVPIHCRFVDGPFTENGDAVGAINRAVTLKALAVWLAGEAETL